MSARSVESAALDRARLEASFSAVPAGIKLLGGPIVPANPAIFQINIQRSQRFGEYFQIWPGDRHNEIEVLSLDRSFTQLVLRVKERHRSMQLRAPLGQGDRPHVADSVVRIDRRVRTARHEYRRPEVYARGAIVHPDHRTLWLEDWRKVVRNREVGGQNDGLRVRWID